MAAIIPHRACLSCLADRGIAHLSLCAFYATMPMVLWCSTTTAGVGLGANHGYAGGLDLAPLVLVRIHAQQIVSRTAECQREPLQHVT